MPLYLDPQTGSRYRSNGTHFVRIDIAGQSQWSSADQRLKIRVWSVALFTALVLMSATILATTPYGRMEKDRQGPSQTVAEQGSQAPETVASGKDTIVRRDRNGHFSAAVSIGQWSGQMLVDTGAGLISLNYSDAIRAGVDPSRLQYTTMVQTANGVSTRARTRIRKVDVGSITLTDVDALIGHRGDESENLLGMSFLGRLSSFEFRGSELILRP